MAHATCIKVIVRFSKYKNKSKCFSDDDDVAIRNEWLVWIGWPSSQQLLTSHLIASLSQWTRHIKRACTRSLPQKIVRLQHIQVDIIYAWGMAYVNWGGGRGKRVACQYFIKFNKEVVWIRTLAWPRLRLWFFWQTEILCVNRWLSTYFLIVHVWACCEYRLNVRHRHTIFRVSFSIGRAHATRDVPLNCPIWWLFRISRDFMLQYRLSNREQSIN